MSAGFTPGPWELDGNSDIRVAGGNYVASAMREEDCRLIAAAPDGFEAGEDAIAALNAMMATWFDYHDAHSLTQPVTGAAGNAFNMALAAREKLEAFVAKANGEQVHSDPLPKQVGR